MRKVVTVLALMMVALQLGAGTAAAEPGSASVAINVDTEFADEGGTFVAHGGVVCPAGSTSDVSTTYEAGRWIFFDVHKTFTCADGSGTFTLRIRAAVRLCDPYDTGTWTVESGTGAYTQLTGSGWLVGSYLPDNSCTATGIEDHLVGKMHLT